MSDYAAMNTEDDDFDESIALAELIREGVIITLWARQYLLDDGSVHGPTLILHVLCSDTFAYSCADCECIDGGELAPLHAAWKAHGHRGVTLWVAEKRGATPIAPVLADLRAHGLWPEEPTP